MFQVLFFFMISCKILCKNPFNLFSYFFYKITKITKIKIKSFECPKSIKSIKKNNAWNIRLLVDDLFVPLSKQPSVIYCRLTDFLYSLNKNSCRKVSDQLPFRFYFLGFGSMCKLLAHTSRWTSGR